MSSTPTCGKNPLDEGEWKQSIGAVSRVTRRNHNEIVKLIDKPDDMNLTPTKCKRKRGRNHLQARRDQIQSFISE